MPIIGYKQRFKNIDYLKDMEFIIKFKLKYTENGVLKFDNQENIYFDSGDYRILIEKVFDNFNEKKLREYDNGVLMLSICKYLVDNIPNIYKITYESNSSIDTYYKDEIIEDYALIKNHLDNLNN